MPRTFNYTDRQSIFQRDVEVRVQELTDGAQEVHLRAQLSDYRFPLDASARLVANTSSSVWWLFEGRVRDFSTPCVFRVTDVDDWDAVRFRLRVSDRDTGKLLGTTRRFKLPHTEEDSTGILTVRNGPTGELPYKLDLSSHASPTLIISDSLWEQRLRLRENPMFRSLMLPDVMRQILRFAILDAGLFEDGSDDAADDNWFGDWIEWMNIFEGLEGFVDSLRDVAGDPDASLTWIEDAVAAFAQNPSNRFARKLIQHMEAQQ